MATSGTRTVVYLPVYTAKNHGKAPISGAFANAETGEAVENIPPRNVGILNCTAASYAK